jgi:hypothetical protein
MPAVVFEYRNMLLRRSTYSAESSYSREQDTTSTSTQIAETCEYCGGIVDADLSDNATLWAAFAGECFCAAGEKRTKKQRP